MSSLRALVAGAVVLGLLSNAAQAQPGPPDPRERFRRSEDRPQRQQKFDDALRKFKSDDLRERLEGIQALAASEKEPRAVQYLLEAANDPNPTVRVTAIDALGTMRAKEATGPLLQRIVMRDTDDATERRILAALGRIGDPRASRPLVDLVHRPDISTDTKASALYALGEIGDPSALPTIEEFAAHDTSDPLSAVAKAARAKIQNRPPPTEVPPALASDRFGPRAGAPTD